MVLQGIYAFVAVAALLHISMFVLYPRELRSLSSSMEDIQIAPHMDGKKPVFRAPTLVNYTQAEGYDPIASPYIMEAEMVSKYKSFYGIQEKPIVYFITPTYKRNTQLVDLVQLSQTLQHDNAVYWIIIEDAEFGSKRVRDLLERSGLMFAHVAIKSIQSSKHWNAPRGVLQRNLGIDTVESIDVPGVVYFGDDDNAYDARLMEGIRYTKGVGIFGVGFRQSALYARCKVDPQTGKIKGMTSRRYSRNNFAMDMAGFCAHSDLIKEKKARFRANSPAGRIENVFLKQLVSHVSEMEPLLDNCTRIYAWHVQTKISRIGPPNTKFDSELLSIQPGV